MDNLSPWEKPDFWNDIDTVLLDMDGTLLDLHFDNYFWKTILPEAYTKKIEQSNTHNTLHKNGGSYQDLNTLFSEKAGTLDWYCLDFWEEALGIDIMALKNQYTHLIGFRPGVVGFLNFLQEKNITPVLVTNAHRKSLNLKLLTCPLNNWMENIYSSHDFGLPKENTDFWKAFSSTYPFNINKTVFIDDNDSVLSSAKAFGIKYLFSIEKPDSTMTEPHQSAFPKIIHFNDLIEK